MLCNCVIIWFKNKKDKRVLHTHTQEQIIGENGWPESSFFILKTIIVCPYINTL